MLKMHGIVIDENKTVIANIDTLEKEKQGTLTFRFVYDDQIILTYVFIIVENVSSYLQFVFRKNNADEVSGL